MESSVLGPGYSDLGVFAGLETGDAELVSLHFDLLLQAKVGQFPDEKFPLGVEIDLSL